MLIERMGANRNSFRVHYEDRGYVAQWLQRNPVHVIEDLVLRQVEGMLEPGESGEFEIIVRRKIQEVAHVV